MFLWRSTSIDLGLDFLVDLVRFLLFFLFFFLAIRFLLFFGLAFDFLLRLFFLFLLILIPGLAAFRGLSFRRLVSRLTLVAYTAS